MNQIKARWTSESPDFFKTLSLIGKFLVGAGGVVMAACIAAPEIIAPGILEWLKLGSSYMVFGGGIIVGVSNLTVNSTSELQDKISNDEKNTTADQ